MAYVINEYEAVIVTSRSGIYKARYHNGSYLERNSNKVLNFHIFSHFEISGILQSARRIKASKLAKPLRCLLKGIRLIFIRLSLA